MKFKYANWKNVRLMRVFNVRLKTWLSAPSSRHQFKTSTKKNSQFRQFYLEVGNSKLGKLETDVACKYFVYSNRNEKMCDFESDAQNHKFCEFLIHKREF